MIDINRLNIQLEQSQARWRAGETAISKLPLNQFKAMLGWIKSDIINNPNPIRPESLGQGGPARNVDWRNYNGNHVTPVENQGGCGSCTSFAATALIESMVSIEHGLTVDLSEADLHFCSSHGANCGGWDNDSPLEYIRTRGIVYEKQFPYSSAFLPNGNPQCIFDHNHDMHSVKITQYNNIFSVEDRKKYLTNVGPCIAGLTIYEDFMVYPGGIYTHLMGAGVGGHCVEIIGYSDDDQCWICKNSWGPDWGENGFFRIAYGQCDIDTENDVEKTYFTSAGGVIVPTMASPVNGDPFSVMDKWGTFHILYRDINNQISDIYYQDGRGWQYIIHNVANAPSANGDPFSVIDKWGTFHILYRDVNNQISDIYYQDGAGWRYTNLSLANAPLANGDPFSIMDNWGTFHVIYRDVNNQISDIYYQDGAGWRYTNLSLANAPLANGDPFSIMDNWGTFHVVYKDVNNHISDFYYQNGAGWQYTNLSLPNSPSANGDPFSIMDKWGTFHILYKDANNQISDIYYQDGAGWQYINHSIANAPLANGDPFSIMDNWGTFHILYRDINNQVSDVYYQDGSGWQYINHSIAYAPLVNGYPFSAMDNWGTFHILYRDINNLISDVYFNQGNGWKDISFFG